MAERALLCVEGVNIELSDPENVLVGVCAVELRTNQLDLVSGERRISLPFSVIKSIDLHQPIFGANYLIGEYTNEERRQTFTLTFSRGGATELTRLFFRLTAGEVQEEHGATAPEMPQQTTDDKKNR